jgi:hypothetical protein
VIDISSPASSPAIADPGQDGAREPARSTGGLPGPVLPFLSWAAVVIAAAWTFLDYWNYNRMNRDDPGEWSALLAGRGIAPAQYRVGVLRLGALLARIAHLQLRHVFAALDFLALLVGLGAVLLSLTRSLPWKRFGVTAQWALGLGCLALLQFYLPWAFWFQKPETMATFAVLALSAAAAQIGSGRHRVAMVLAMLMLAAAGATVRADAVVALHAGLLLACLLPGASGFRLGRALQAATSASCIGAAAAVQLYIERVLYPAAQRNVAAFQLLGNLHSLNGYLALGLGLTPWWLTLWLVARRWRVLDGWGRGLLLGSVVHFCLFYSLGMAEEVRIFLPFAMVLVPVTLRLIADRIAGEAGDSLTDGELAR